MENFKSNNFVGKTVVCHIDFIPYLQKFDAKLKELGLKFHTTSSWRSDINVKGAIVKPAKNSNHLVGFAIDGNIWEGKKLWNSKLLTTPSGKVLELIEWCPSIGMRWGGYFKVVDVVHFDFPLNLKDRKKYDSILSELNSTNLN